MMSQRSGRKPSRLCPTQETQRQTPPVCREDAAEVRGRLQGRDETIDSQRDDPSPAHRHALSSRTACHTSRAPPILATAASAINRTDRAIVMQLACHRTMSESCRHSTFAVASAGLLFVLRS